MFKHGNVNGNDNILNERFPNKTIRAELSIDRFGLSFGAVADFPAHNPILHSYFLWFYPFFHETATCMASFVG